MIVLHYVELYIPPGLLACKSILSYSSSEYRITDIIYTV